MTVLAVATFARSALASRLILAGPEKTRRWLEVFHLKLAEQGHLQMLLAVQCLVGGLWARSKQEEIVRKNNQDSYTSSTNPVELVPSWTQAFGSLHVASLTAVPANSRLLWS